MVIATNTDRRLMTIKKVSLATGISKSFLYRLLQKRELRRYKVHELTCISMSELEELMTPKEAVAK